MVLPVPFFAAHGRSQALVSFHRRPDPLETTDEPVESRELDNTTDAGRSGDPLEGATDVGLAQSIFSTESRDRDTDDVAGGSIEVAVAAALDGGAPEVV